MTISETLVLEFDREVAKTRKLLECAPEERFAWHPPGQAITLVCLVRSIVEDPDNGGDRPELVGGHASGP